MYTVLSYDAPHRKTQDLLFRLKALGYNNINVVATPWVAKKKIFKPLIPHRPTEVLDIPLATLCENLGYPLTICEPSDLAAYFAETAPEYILIGGAGILAPEIVQSGKIINSHPAYLPYVRGLDALKWAVYENKPIGVTTHIISEEADAGKLIRREKLPLYYWDTFHSVAQRQYELEIAMLAEAIEDIKTAELSELSTAESEPHRRMPHSKEMRLMKRFQDLIDNLPDD
jgi:phosphoribosylglycinamide formyltransferase-1